MKILIVSPHFPPTNAADMHRVRVILPYLRAVGVEAEVLAVHSAAVASPEDAWLANGLPCDVPVHRVNAMSLRWSRIPGLGTLVNRARGALRRRGDALLSGSPFDLIYFSTTQFGIHTLGPRWRRRFGVPFVMDYQDPWVSDYYEAHPDVSPPGGRLKYAIASWLARRAEPRVLRECGGITSVSPAYPRQLKDRYSFLPDDWPVLVAPFPGDELDLQRVAKDPAIQQSIFDPADGCRHWVYVGRGGKDMHRSLCPLFFAMQRERQLRPEKVNDIRLHFIGTSYAAAGLGAKTIAPLAAEYGLDDLLVESTDRIPYSTTLRCLLDANALIVPGSDDVAYTASKIYPYLLAKKPMLAIFADESSVVKVIECVGGAKLVTFNARDENLVIAERIRETWFQQDQCNLPCDLDIQQFHQYSAASQAERLCDFFQACLSRDKF